MSYSVRTIAKFDKQLKRLVKKYPSLKAEFTVLIQQLSDNPVLGTSIGNDCYKIRVSIASKGKGKSGGARVISFIQFTQTQVTLLAIYDKSEQEDISDNDLLHLISNITD